jgi:FkbM family methyltransferase
MQLNPYIFRFDVIKKYSVSYKHINFIQIGSNDGITRDPIHKYITTLQWNGVLVEPVNYLFNKLKETYKECQDRLYFENCAISEQGGYLEFYRLRKSDSTSLPCWYNQIGSFRKEVVLRHRDLIPEFDKLFIEEKVRSVKFIELIKKHKLNHVDLIMIDTEGYDFEIIKTIPFNKLNIQLLMFEHKHLNRMDYVESVLLLRKAGFVVGPLVISPLVKDTIAIRPKLLKTLISLNVS